ncbi:hypothetical protein [Methylocystis hirsuta]|uniref:Uncharacterized protein n=1 Tax=Methylocystis hirsuta TaxID=369798 RepID=A0A3M9XTI9_9HYPH|nr:hypothetical protein [Methylocystis hirsuta]RNJ51334.1 hypothetical protein D1O30_18790 [Methylocystis hirsuta]
MDQLDREIEAKRRQRDEAKRAFDQLELEVRTLEYAASLRPTAPFSKATVAYSEPPRRGGKPHGSIAMGWRRVLADLADARHFPEAFREAAQRRGANVSLQSVKDRLRSFEGYGYVEGDAERGYLVTQMAVDKFDLRNINKGTSPENPEEVP